MTKILLAIDGSENAERALLEARNYLEYTGGELTILTVLDYPVLMSDIGKKHTILPNNLGLENSGRLIIEDALKLFQNGNYKINTKIRRGNPGDEIIEEASGDYDLIIMGSRGKGTFSRVILGSVSNKVLNHTKKNIMIVK